MACRRRQQKKPTAQSHDASHPICGCVHVLIAFVCVFCFVVARSSLAMSFVQEFSSMLSTSVVAVIKRGTKVLSIRSICVHTVVQAYQDSGTALMAPRVCELLEKAAETVSGCAP